MARSGDPDIHKHRLKSQKKISPYFAMLAKGYADSMASKRRTYRNEKQRSKKLEAGNSAGKVQDDRAAAGSGHR